MALPDYNFAASGSGLPDFRVQVVNANGVPVVLDTSEPTAAVNVVDEFLFSSTETGEHGDLGWSVTNGSANLVNPVADHPGILARASGNTIGQVASMYSAGGGGAPAIRNDQWSEITWIVYPTSATGDHDVRIGVSTDFTAAAPAGGIYFEKLAADTNWFAVVRNSSTETRTTTGVAYAVGWFKLKMRRISSTSIGFSVNGGTEIVMGPTNVPLDNAVFIFGNHIIPQSANARTLWIDFFSMKMVAQSR